MASKAPPAASPEEPAASAAAAVSAIPVPHDDAAPPAHRDGSPEGHKSSDDELMPPSSSAATTMNVLPHPDLHEFFATLTHTLRNDLRNDIQQQLSPLAAQSLLQQQHLSEQQGLLHQIRAQQAELYSSVDVLRAGLHQVSSAVATLQDPAHTPGRTQELLGAPYRSPFLAEPAARDPEAPYASEAVSAEATARAAPKARTTLVTTPSATGTSYTVAPSLHTNFLLHLRLPPRLLRLRRPSHIQLRSVVPNTFASTLSFTIVSVRSQPPLQAVQLRLPALRLARNGMAVLAPKLLCSVALPMTRTSFCSSNSPSGSRVPPASAPSTASSPLTRTFPLPSIGPCRLFILT